MFLNRKIIFPILSISLIFIYSCRGIKHAARYEPTDLHSSYLFDDNRSFSEYINDMKKIIAESMKFRNPEYKMQLRQILDANTPFEFYPDSERRGKGKKIKNGILLIHGLSDSPFIMRDIGEYFQKKSFLVRAVLLPGHGTVPGDLSDIKFERWIEAVRYGINSFAGEVENLYIAGFSTGGTLALYFGLNQDKINRNIQGLVLLSPAVKVFYEGFVKYVKFYETILRWKWLVIAEDKDYSRYESFPLNAAYQVYLLSDKLGGEKKIDIPLIMVLSQDDSVVVPDASRDFFDNRVDAPKRFILYKNNPQINGEGNIEERESRYPERNILNFSHLSIPVSYDNPHYGENGDYKNCLKYSRDKTALATCLNAKESEMVYGALGLKEEIFWRLTYNPDFENMCEAIYDFITDY